MDIKPTDIFICSFPRSGNTWCRHIITNIKFPNGDEEKGIINRTVPDLHSPITTNDVITKCPHPRAFKSHWPYRPEYRRVIYLYRDPRDVAISYYHFSIKTGSWQGVFDKWIEFFLSDNFNIIPRVNWKKHIKSWLGNADRVDDFIAISYEYMVTHIYEVARQISNFIGLDADENLIKHAVEKSSFNRINDLYNRTNKLGYLGVKGGPGKWKETLSNEQNEMFWNKWGDLMTEFGYEK